MATQYANGQVDAAPGEDPVRVINGKQMRWEDPDEITHVAEGAQMIATDPGTFILWTACGLHDIPAGEAFFGDDNVTCPHCVDAVTEGGNSKLGVPI